MTRNLHRYPTLPPELAGRLDPLCDRFEAAWQAGERPRLEEFLPLLEEPERPALLGELLALELGHRRRLGEQPTAGEYRARLPAYASLIDAVFAPSTVLSSTGPVAADTPDRPVTGTRYRPLRLHARGGLGEVHLAHDEELHRDVALKRMRGGCADDPDSLRRFLLEAEVTARLEHPGIVPVYGLVHDAAGQPCYAMRFIEGQSLKEAVEQFHQADRPGRDAGERTLALRKLLGDFVSVCKAIGYAHSRGVVHRDLKPQNIMLGKYGEVLVVDWGLAKKVQRTDAERTGGEESVKPTTAESDGEGTRLGQAMGTPAYMSPEQAEGRWDILRPASDIYSLGATLFALLTGRAPFQGSTHDILEKVKRGEILPPRQVHKDVPRPLEAICLKAMARRPEDRYETALDLADDVERWLADEAVTAYPEPWTARAGRWLRRRKPLVISAAAILLVLALGGGAAVFWYQHQEADHQRRLGDTQNGLELAVNEATVLLDRGLQEVNNPVAWRKTLEAARTVTEQARALLAREPELREGAAGQRVQQLASRLDAEEKDRALVATFEEVLFKLLDKRCTHPEGFRDMKRALALWGLPLGEVPAERVAARIGQRPQAVRPQLHAILQWCFYEAAQQKEQQRWLADVLKAADPDPWRGRLREAVTAQDRILLEKLVDEADVDHQPTILLVGIGAAPLLEGKPCRIALLRRVQQSHPEEFWANYDLAHYLYQSVFPHGATPETPATDHPAVIEALRFYSVAVAARPGNPSAYSGLGMALRARGDLAGAITCYHKALKLDPRFATAHYNLGNALAAQKDLEGAIASFRKAIECDPAYVHAHHNLASALFRKRDLEGALDHHKKTIQLDSRYALAYLGLGAVLDAKGDAEGAITAYRKAIELDPTEAVAYYNLGNTLVAKKDTAAAIPSYRKAIELDPGYVAAHYNLGLALGKQGDLKGAIASYTEALKLDPRHVQARYCLGNALRERGDLQGAFDAYTRVIELDPKFAPAHNNLGIVLHARKDVAGAIARFQKAVEIDSKYAEAYYNLGTVLKGKGDLAGAIPCFHKAIAADPRYVLAHNNLGNVLLAQGDTAGAIACYRKALDIDPNHPFVNNNLGNALKAQGDLKGAIACYRKAIASDPLYAVAHFGLGLALKDQGDVEGAKACFEKALECEQLQKLSARLSSILQGDAKPRDAAERLALADLCRQYKKRYVAAARFYADAFADGAALAPPRAYQAACAAALAAAGKGQDASGLDDKQKAQWRNQALNWLRESLRFIEKQLASVDARERAAIQRALQDWQKDRNLESVRDGKALAGLPEAQRPAWQQFWTEVEALRRKAAARPGL
jgi:tetratricopeptide (TPR) repeat protein/tRNA A-37 threonylcarbamoyl transferase component Bud32